MFGEGVFLGSCSGVEGLPSHSLPLGRPSRREKTA